MQSRSPQSRRWQTSLKKIERSLDEQRRNFKSLSVDFGIKSLRFSVGVHDRLLSNSQVIDVIHLKDFPVRKLPNKSSWMLDILQRRTCLVIASNWGLANSMRILSVLNERSWRSFIHFYVSCLTPQLATICFWISFHCFPFSFVSLNFIDYQYGHKTLERAVESLNATARATFGFEKFSCNQTPNLLSCKLYSNRCRP